MSTTRGRQRFTPDAARAALVAAGRQILIERGIAPGLDRVTLKEAIERSDVPRTTAYRVFGGDGGARAGFHNAILAELDASADADESIALVAEMLEQARSNHDFDDPIVLADALREMIRVGFNHRVHVLMHQAEWRAYVSSIAGLENGPTEENEPARASATDTSARFVPMFEMVGSVFGLRPRPPLTWSGFAALLAATLDGAALRTLVDPHFDDIRRSFQPENPERRWNGVAVVAEALFLSWTEPDPRATASADLSQWTAYRPGEL